MKLGSHTRSITMLVVVAALACAHAPLAREDVQREILQLEEQRREAQLRGDWQTIQRLNAPDFTEIAGTGMIRTAAQNAEDMRAGRTKFSSIVCTDLQAQSYGNVAIVTGMCHRLGSFAGTPFEQRFRFSRTYARRDGAWRAVFAQTTRLETAP